MNASRFSVFCFGAAAGWTVQQCMIVAPILIKKLDKEGFRKTIRPIWSKFYRGLFIIESVNAACIYQSREISMSIQFHIATASAIICALCIYIIPMMNDASDSSGREAQKTFSRLHHLSVGGTSMLLLGNVSTLFL